jgi:hypothetical protein
MKSVASLLLLVVVYVFPQISFGQDKKLSVYFIGNSLTMSSTLDRVHGFFGQRGIDLQFGSQVSGGKSLFRHLNYKDEPKQKWISWETSVPSGGTFTPHANFYQEDPKNWRFGLYDKALPSHAWDAVVMQPYASTLLEDMKAIPTFIGLALKGNPTATFYVYQTWPNRPRTKVPGAVKTDPDVKGERVVGAVLADDIDYPALWDAEYTATVDQTDKKAGQNASSRDYYRDLMKAIGEQVSGTAKPVRLIPVGEILYVLDGKIKRNELPGLEELAQRDPSMIPGLRPGTDFSKGVNVLYADPIHFNAPPHQKGVLGNFVSGTSLFTVLSGQSPVGLSAAAYGLDDVKDAALIRAVQETIWQVVTSEPATGIAGP